MKTRRRNLAAAVALYFVMIAVFTWLVNATTTSFDLSDIGVGVIGFFGGLMCGFIAGYVYLELETRRKRLVR